MTKATESQKRLIVALLMVIVMFAAYQYGYKYFVGKAETLQTENEELNTRIVGLKAKIEKEKKYELDTAANRQIAQMVLKRFGTTVTPEKSILFFVDLCEKADMEISAISFGTPVAFFNASHLKDEEGALVRGNRTSLGITYTASYEGLKACVEHIKQYPERMSLSTLTATYSAEEAALSGTMTVEWFNLVTGEEEKIPELENIDLGTDNIFRSGNIPVPNY
ncbi:MAG: hypothetical protein IJY09_04360 [Lachnospiraceae bacterium]|nr:hypothetical protein [Lachnospiraceae bacterium]